MTTWNILGVPVTLDFSLPLTQEEINEKIDEWENLLEQGKQEEAQSLYDKLTEDGAIG